MGIGAWASVGRGRDAVMDHIVFDVEIQKTIEELSAGWADTHLMGVACACVWQYQDARMRIYGPEDVEALKDRLLRADRISSFNGFNFDYLVIWGLSRLQWSTECEELKARLLPKTNDILRRIWEEGLNLNPDMFNPKTHGGWGLDAVSKATLNAPGKIGHGGDAPKWFQAGQWARVANYCADDVALERDLTDFVDRYGYVSNGEQTVQLSKETR